MGLRAQIAACFVAFDRTWADGALQFRTTLLLAWAISLLMVVPPTTAATAAAEAIAPGRKPAQRGTVQKIPLKSNPAKQRVAKSRGSTTKRSSEARAPANVRTVRRSSGLSRDRNRGKKVVQKNRKSKPGVQARKRARSNSRAGAKLSTRMTTKGRTGAQNPRMQPQRGTFPQRPQVAQPAQNASPVRTSQSPTRVVRQAPPLAAPTGTTVAQTQPAPRTAEAPVGGFSSMYSSSLPSASLSTPAQMAPLVKKRTSTDRPVGRSIRLDMTNKYQQ